MRKINQKLIIIAALLFLFQFIIQPALAEDKPVLDYYYSGTCGTCGSLLNGVITPIKNIYNDTVVVQLKDISKNSTYNDEYNAYLDKYHQITGFPFAVLKGKNYTAIIIESDISIDFLSKLIDNYLAGIKTNMTFDENVTVINTIFGWIKIDVTGLALPVLTVVLGGLDSLNPCAFFILIILLSLLLYARSRRRMLLIGGVFIFFSGLLYYIFMFAMYNTFFLTKAHMGIITIVAGVIALVLGSINIKDFFFFKKGASLSIPEDKKPGLFKQMRDLVKTPQLTVAIFGTIILAATVNFYELLCTLGLPLVFTRQLASYNLPVFQSYLYIFFYNVVYVIPLIIIVLVFVLTLGRIKLSEWHGRFLKLLTGIMLASFGALFLIDYQILENIVTPILLLVFSLLATFVISFVWKRYKDKEETI